MLVNPPYGARLEDESTLGPLYAQLGRQLMGCFPGWEAGVFTGNPPLGRSLRLRAYRAHTFFNGPIECRLLRFELQPGTVEPDPETARRNRLNAARARPGSSMFGNRVRKNLAHLEKWARRADVACFRVYDADMPEYAFAIDVYGNDQRWACVQEYAPPETVALDAARGRRDEALAVLPEVLGLPAERIVMRVRRRQRGGEQYEKVGEEAQFHTVREGPYRFLVNFTDYLDTGLFLDHRITRRRVGELAAGRAFLNLFAYTGTATVHAVGGGATASTDGGHVANLPGLGEAQPRVERSRRAAARFPAGGLPRLARRAESRARDRRYGLIFVDPPTLSRSKRMEREFDVQRDHLPLLQIAGRLLEPDGVIVFSNNFQRFKLDAAVQAEFDVEDISRATFPRTSRAIRRSTSAFCCARGARGLRGADDLLQERSSHPWRTEEQ